MSMFSFINDIKMIPYKRVPACPYCKSRVTGYFINSHRKKDDDWARVEALKNGEIVIPVDTIGEENCFCVECHKQFKAPIYTEMYSKSQIQMEILARGTQSFLDAEYEAGYNKKSNGLAGLFLNYIGRV